MVHNMSILDAQGLSLGTEVIKDIDGRAVGKQQRELSVVQEPRRPFCYIDVIDGKSVKSIHNHSAGAIAKSNS